MGEGTFPELEFFDIEQVSDQASDLPHMLPPPSDFAVAARRAGISSHSTIVVCDGQGIFSAPRIWWTFRVMGHAAIAVLDGGLPRWLAEGRPVESGWREPHHGDFKARFDPSLIRDLAQVQAALTDGSAQIVDARPSTRFTGEAPEPRPGLRSGHMPGARNVPFSSLIDADGKMLGEAQVRAAFELAGVDLTRPIVTTCGSGISAALLALALERIGHPGAAVYDGSWTEWGAHSATPVVVGPA